MRNIETVIQRLGYHNSEKLFYLSEIDKCTDLSCELQNEVPLANFKTGN